MVPICGYCESVGHATADCAVGPSGRDPALIIDSLLAERAELCRALREEQEHNLTLTARVGHGVARDVRAIANSDQSQDPYARESPVADSLILGFSSPGRDRDGPEVLTPHTRLRVDMQAVHLMLDRLEDRLADIQRRLPRDAQPVVVHLADILQEILDTVASVEDALTDRARHRAPSLDRSLERETDEALTAARRRPQDTRDTLLTLQHVPGVEDGHLERVARLADGMEIAIAAVDSARQTYLSSTR